MYSKKLYIVYCLLIVFLILPSCKALKKNGGNKKNKNVLSIEKKLDENRFAPEWMSGKMKVKYKDDSFSQAFNMNFRMKKDSVIWLSATMPIINYEVVRAKITPNSIEALDQYNKHYYNKDFDFVEEMIGYPLSFAILQDLIFGNPMENAHFEQLETVDGLHCLSSDKCTLFLTTEDFTIQKMLIEEKEFNRSLTANYEDYKLLDNKPFSNKRNLLMQAGGVFVADIQFTKLNVNQQLDFPFSVSSKYKQVD